VQPVLFKDVLKDQNGPSFFSNGLSKYCRNSLYDHNQNTRKPCCTWWSHLMTKTLR